MPSLKESFIFFFVVIVKITVVVEIPVFQFREEASESTCGVGNRFTYFSIFLKAYFSE